MENLIKHIDDYFISKQFTKRNVGEVTVYELEKEIHSPSQIMMINGRTFEQPGDVIKIILKCYNLGLGSMDDVPLLFLQFVIEQNNESSGVEYSFFKDDKDYFNHVCSNVFNI